MRTSLWSRLRRSPSRPSQSIATSVPHLTAYERAELAMSLNSAEEDEWRSLAKALANDYLIATKQRVSRRVP